MAKALPDSFPAYEAGKARRYGLLFSVNGGGFAIAKFSGEPQVPLGALSLGELAVGMALFTIVMTCDIWAFGNAMRETVPADRLQVFGTPGKVVLTSLCGLIVCGWLLVAMR